MNQTTPQIHLIEFELGCASDLRAVYARRPDSNEISLQDLILDDQ